MAPGAAQGAEISPDVFGLKPVVMDLNGPRGVSVMGSRTIVYGELDGSVSKTVRRGEGAGTELLATFEPQFIAPAVAQDGHQKVWILTPGGEPGTGGSTLYRWTERSGEATAIADIAAYQVTDPDPDDLEGIPEESNPYGVEALGDGSALVADAAGNDLLRVYENGDIETVARIKPRTVLVPDELEGQPDVPPPGTPLPSEGVATSVTVGSDGYYYVGELRGFPATPDTSQVWRIAPDSVDAVCDPEAPNTGDCQLFADGFTSIVDLAPGPDGDIYVLELVQQSWFQWELGLSDGAGGLFHAVPGEEPVELVAGALFTPGGIDTSRNDKAFVSTPIFEPGYIGRVRDTP